MLQNYIQTLKELYEKLSQQNINTPEDILTAWKLTVQIMLSSLIPIAVVGVALAAHVYLYKLVLHKFYLEKDADTEVGVFVTVGYILFTTIFVLPFVAPVVMYFL